MSSNLDRFKQKYREQTEENEPPDAPEEIRIQTAPRFIKDETKSIAEDIHTRKRYEESYDPNTRITHVSESEDAPIEDNEVITIRDGRIIKRERTQKYYDKDRKTIVTRHGLEDDTPADINEVQTIKDGRVIKRELTEKFYDKNENRMITRQSVFDDAPIERHEEIHSLDGHVYGREITEKSYDSKENVQLTRHGMDWKKLGCGHTMQKGGTFYQCCVCGKTICDDCGKEVNGNIFCMAHVLQSRHLLR